MDNLPSPTDSVLELTKGKLTTDPEHHAGEGIFFTSRMFDQFTLSGNGLALMHLLESGDWFIRDTPRTTLCSGPSGSSLVRAGICLA